MRKTIAAVGLAILMAAAPASAIDHKNLDEGRPLRLEDAYPIASDEIALEAGGGLRLSRRGADQGFFPIELLYGVFPNAQVGVGTTLFSDPHAVDDRPKSGDLHLSALDNFNQETIDLPAFGLKLALDAPTGVRGRGFGVEVKGIIHEHAKEHHEATQAARRMPAGSLNRTAFSATVHCLTGCAIGEVLGMVAGTGLGLSNLVTIALSVGLAFVFGYALTMLPLLRAGLSLTKAAGLAFASDTASIALMEIVDNLIMVIIPGAMAAGPTRLLFWGSLAVSLLIAGALAFPLNRWLIARGMGHSVIHSHHQ